MDKGGHINKPSENSGKHTQRPSPKALKASRKECKLFTGIKKQKKKLVKKKYKKQDKFKKNQTNNLFSQQREVTRQVPVLCLTAYVVQHIHN